MPTAALDRLRGEFDLDLGAESAGNEKDELWRMRDERGKTDLSSYDLTDGPTRRASSASVQPFFQPGSDQTLR